MNKRLSDQRGEFNPLIIIIIVLSLLFVSAGGLGIWAYINYTDQKNNVDQKIAAAESEARRVQSEQDQATFAEQEKLPNREFVGPDDLGRVAFMYPKTWSAYIDKDGSSGTYEAYFQPGAVPPLSSGTPYALRVSILDKSYESTLESYADEVKKGEVKSTAASANGISGNRLEGKIDKDVDGVMMIFKLREKTLQFYTESRTFQADLDNTILPSLTFNS
ncbi:MAG: hypothetical protein PVI21_05130 [Candidatus Woesebacteria bacterium]|jgi:hypothetical protein